MSNLIYDKQLIKDDLRARNMAAREIFKKRMILLFGESLYKSSNEVKKEDKDEA